MTAVEFLKSQAEKLKYLSPEIFELAKQMEKQQIIDAYDEGQEYEYQYHINNTPKFDSQTYYAETYGSKGSDEMTTNSSQLEISDEEIKDVANRLGISTIPMAYFIDGAKWYREQLKQRQNG